MFTNVAARVRAGGLLVARLTQSPPATGSSTSFPTAPVTAECSGHVDEGEDFLAAAVRETQEEAGISPSDLRLIESFNKDLFYEARGKPKQSRYFLAVLKNPQTPVMLSDEHSHFQWAACEEAAALCGFEDMGRLLKEADAYLQQQIISPTT
ncbi:bis(5'-nucleosyl)-tetraphosphatase [asymmetrical] [Cyclospora cayetanensis]|uniref:Bis(5'-nucleosyl)-tetraphosphatase [asymmetrical] n=1 Tax=Cyclospora cayetanensis TaxID=88456 RepID=A0A6P6RYS0_9EIME|nr:bis(5'-nucleosyl)-tetraphosphatase [asymmetrical] [Cyclospora cayetanensis]